MPKTSQSFSQQVSKVFAVKPYPVPEKATYLDGIRQKVFLDRYAWKGEDSKPIEEVPDQMWARVARTLAEVEKTPALRKDWEEKFYQALDGFKFLPGGRILSAAGTGYEVTYYNCFVLPSPDDSRGGILDNLKMMTEILSRAGGAGINLSTLRPKGARVHKVNGTSSGPVNWANLYSVASHDVIQQGGSRRGALMIMLCDWHPDIVEFIEAKKDLTRLVGANLSVCLSDAFMEAVENDLDWTLRFPEIKDPHYDTEWDGDVLEWGKKGYGVKIYETVKAREIWDKICLAAWTSAEPGIHFLERSNKWSNLWYTEKLICTNPCVTGDTLVSTSSGWKRADQIIKGEEIATVLGSGKVDSIEVNKSCPVYKVELSDGARLRVTFSHQLHAIHHEERAGNSANKKFSLIPVDQLKVGDLVRIAPGLMPDNPVSDLPLGWKEKDYGFFVGVILGDGCITEKTLNRNVVKIAVDTNEPEWCELIKGVLKKAGSRTVTVDSNEGYSANLLVQNIGGAAMLVKKSLLTPAYSYEKQIPLEYQRTNRQFLSGLLDGLFSTDGNVNLRSNHPFLRLKTTSLQLALDVRRILLSFGIHGRVVKVGHVKDGHIGKRAIIARHKQYEVIISGWGVKSFAEQIGLSHPDKQKKLKEARLNFALTGNTWLARIISIEPGGVEDVYDLHEPVSDTWITEGVVSRGCGEQPLPAWGVCNLGSLNLAAFVKDGGMDYELLRQVTTVATRMLDNVIDANFYFYDQNETTQKQVRRIGLGTMGLGDALIKMKLRYGSEESLPVIEKIYQAIRDAAYDTSTMLAKEKGAFPKFEKDKYLAGYFIKQLPEDIKQQISKNGIRNAVLLTQAPTGSTSLLAGVSSGIEPVFDFVMKRKDRIGEHVIYHPLFQEWKEANPDVKIQPDYFASANDLTPDDHIQVQAAVQKYTDSSISKTVNAPNSHTVEDVKKLYLDAYKLGCKGTTYYRDGCRESVLSHVEEKVEGDNVMYHRPMILRGRTYKIATPVGEGFVTVNRDEKDLPVEVFVTIGKGGMHTMADAEALGRLASMALRWAGENRKRVAQRMVAQLRGIGGSSQIGFGKERVMSLADAIAKVLAEELAQTESVAPEPLPLDLSVSSGGANGVDGKAMQLGLEREVPVIAVKLGDLCPECGQATFTMEEGCKKCHSCGYSMC